MAEPRLTNTLWCSRCSEFSFIFFPALVCSPYGSVVVVADLTKAMPSALPSKTTLLDKTCTPSEVDEKRVLFEFSLNSCGTRFQV